MNLHLNEKVVIVTGGAKGIGGAITSALVAEGAIPVIIDRDEAAAREHATTLAAVGGLVHVVTADLTQPDACQAAVAAVVKTFGRVDGLVNNAGINDGVGLTSGGYEAFMASLHRNVVHYYLMAHHVVEHLKASRGSIVNISSKVAETGQGGTSAYAAANGGRNALTREWAVELAPFGVRVNAVIVAEAWTPLYENWLAQLPNPAEKRRQIESRIPLGQRMTATEEIANAVVFLLSKRSSHTTGQLIHVDGGYVHLDRARP